MVSGKTFQRRGIFPRPFRCVSHAFEGTSGNARCPSAKRTRRETAIRAMAGPPRRQRLFCATTGNAGQSPAPSGVPRDAGIFRHPAKRRSPLS
ncbi:hypothetical protein DESPIG_02868 [Desulfovibrio piger ATCC 29098]|uniref:Uncharacterized protein n=1 Tax=Desulfovibrio piger ATCC 29098 TaxID=411464 RepID=B6WXP0_9BACT|nr:hypothetical protein DESPIG_02868 [Desulfovibrio piger ATCC 29098]